MTRTRISFLDTKTSVVNAKRQVSKFFNKEENISAINEFNYNTSSGYIIINCFTTIVFNS